MTSAMEARRIAVVAQGLSGPRRASGVSGPQILAAIARLGVLQIDSVNVLARAHYLPLFARLGAYDRAFVDRAAWEGPPKLFEYWGHQASLLPVALHPLFRWRMARALTGAGMWKGVARFAAENRAYCTKVVATIKARGPSAASDLEGEKKGPGGWWGWSEAKHAVEALFWQGRLAVASRRGFERLYDLPERVIPSSILALPTPDAKEAHRSLLELSARALGIFTEDDLCDYFRLARKESRPVIAELVEEGALLPTSVETWDRPAWIHRDFQRIRWKPAAALVGPFDPIVWHRARALRMFGFHYRIGIYTPAPQRTHGYYVLPFLLGDALVARVDLKSDRARSVLSVRGAWLEEGHSAESVAGPLATELAQMAGWLGLERIEVARKGNLSGALRSTVRS